MSTLPTFLRGALILCLLFASLPTIAQFGGGPGDGFGSATAIEEVAMPLDLLSFDARPAPTGVVVEWATENESATSHFVVERTTDGVTYTLIGTTAAAGYSEPGQRLHYALIDGSPVAGTALYRLQSVDLDGTFEYSDLVEVTLREQPALALTAYPNPGNGSELNVQVTGVAYGETVSVQLFDQAGRRVLSRELPQTTGQAVALPLTDRLPAGVYTLRVRHATQGTLAQLVVVQ